MNKLINDKLRIDLSEYINDLGHFPSRAFLKDKDRWDLINIIRKMGGVNRVAASMNIQTYNQFHGLNDYGFWDKHRIRDAFIEFINKHSLEYWPSPAVMRSMGYGDLAAAIGIYAGGHKRFRNELIELGIELKEKPRNTYNLIPFQNKYPITDEIFKEGELKYYFLGLVSADGYINSDEKSVEICLSHSDVSLLELLRDLISPDRPIHDKPSKVKEEYLAKRLKINSIDMFDMVSGYMGVSNKSRDLKWPENIPREFLGHFIRGYFDGDATLGIARAQKELSDGLRYYYIPRIRFLGTEDFLKGLAMTFYRHNKISVAKPYQKGSENVYVLSYSGISAKLIMTYLYKDATIFLKRKKDLWTYILLAPREELERIYSTEEGKLNKRAKEGSLFLETE